MTVTKNLRAMFDKADATDLASALKAYQQYHNLLEDTAFRYRQPMHRVVAAFVSLSPNNDYLSNLRSTVTLLEGVKQKIERPLIVTSTYNHCRDRAYRYLTGEADFIKNTTGPKILNFYQNILDPKSHDWVTVDGHMVAAARDQDLTMKEAIPKTREYEEIKAATQTLAAELRLIPNQVQTCIWFARKRTMAIKYDPQLSLFHDPWHIEIKDVQPFPFLTSAQRELDLKVKK